MKFSIIIVSWNVKKDLINCLNSISENQPAEKHEVIVIDNASTDGTVEMLRNDFPKIVTIVNGENRGFAAANNQGINIAKGQYILLLNPDTIIHPKSLEVLINFMDDNSGVGVCGPKLLNDDDSIQRSARHFPSFRGALYRHTAFKFLGIFKDEYKKWLMKDFGYNEQRDVDQLMGAAMLIRKSVLDSIGGMDERFFMYYEEVDLCFRIKQAGWRVVFMSEAVITHLGGQSSGQIPAEKQLMAMASLLKFFRKHRGKPATMIFGVTFKTAMVIGNIITIVVNAIIYLFALLTVNGHRKCKSVKKIKNSTMLLCRCLML